MSEIWKDTGEDGGHSQRKPDDNRQAQTVNSAICPLLWAKQNEPHARAAIRHSGFRMLPMSPTTMTMTNATRIWSFGLGVPTVAG